MTVNSQATKNTNRQTLSTTITINKEPQESGLQWGAVVIILVTSGIIVAFLIDSFLRNFQ